SVLDYFNWSGWGIGPVAWALLMLGIATVIGLGVTVLRSDWAYGAVLVWAFAGIAVKQSDTAAVMLTAAICAVIMVAAIALALVRRPTLPAATAA
ncbi:MAG: hypothetical protein KDD83_28325, partial [Caldilineaceae bacterium]|nr:hypothetical protein [Caldilineaceae bacterium]